MSGNQIELVEYIDKDEDQRESNRTTQYELVPENVPENWSLIKLKNLLERKSSRIDPENMKDQNYVSLKHMGEGEPRLVEWGTAEGVSSAKYKFESGNILFGKLRPYFRKVAIPKFDGICSTDINVILSTNSVNKKFLFYTLFRKDFIDFTTKTSTGQRPRADWNKLDEMFIALPDNQNLQKKIGKILYELDEKIEVNNRINKLLEDIAGAIFKEWFVDFGPYEEVKDSELGEIPKEFEVVQLDDIANINMGSSPKSEYYNKNEEGLPFFQGRSNFRLTYPKIERWCSKPQKVAEEEDVIITVRAPVGEVNKLMKKSCIGRGLAGLSMKRHNNNFLYYLMKIYKYRWDKYGSGTTYDSVSSDDIKEFPTVKPPENQIEKFNTLAKPLDELIKKNYDENKKLKRIRDTLLPKLMSGEIRVDDLDIK